MEIRSQDSASANVRNGLGAGLAVIFTDLCNSELRVLPLSGLPIRLFSRGTRRDRSAIC